MVSQDVEDGLSKRLIKWSVFAVISIIIVVLFIIFEEKIEPNLRVSLLIVFLLLAFVSLLMSVLNFVVLLKVKSAIRTYHNGNYEKAKELAISAYKLSSYPEINDLIDYIDSQIIDEIITQQERLEQEQELYSDYFQDIADLIEDVELRIKRLEKIKHEISDKLEDLKEQNKVNDPDFKEHYHDLINQYAELLRFTEFKINAYQDVLSKLNALKNKHQHKDLLYKEQEDLRELQDKILTEGYRSQDEDEEEEEIDKNEKIFLEYVKEFLASTTSVENPEEFSRIYDEFEEQLEELELSFN